MSDVQQDAAPASSEPVAAVAPDPVGTVEPTAEQVAQQNAIQPPQPGEALAAVEDVAAAVDAVATDVHPALGALGQIEALALKWGGDVMTEIRNLVAEVKSLL